MEEKELIQRCLKKDRKSQKLIYERYAPTMLGVCRRYVKDEMTAESVMINGFYKAFTKLNQYSNKGPFGGWLRKIMVNESLMELRKKRDFNISLENTNVQIGQEALISEKLAEEDILKLLDLLPTGYRTVFNLYVIEGYSHKEIAEQMQISENTSKSQLIKARKRLKSYLKQLNIAAG